MWVGGGWLGGVGGVLGWGGWGGWGGWWVGGWVQVDVPSLVAMAADKASLAEETDLSGTLLQVPC